MSKIKSIIIMFFLTFILYEILSESSTIITAVNYSFIIWYQNIFPSLFPFFVLSQILIHYGFIELTSNLFKPIFTKFFKINENASFVFFMSMLSGFPSNAKYINELVKSNKLTIKDASKILMFSHFSNPLFILGSISITFLNNKTIGIYVLISHYLSNIIIGFIFRNYNKTIINKTKFNINYAINQMHKKRISNQTPIIIVITNSLINTINTLLLILGIVITFSIITTIIDNNFTINIYLKAIISGMLEITNGLHHINLLNCLPQTKGLIITAILSFGGFSVHAQIMSILSEINIKYLPFLFARIIHVIIASLIYMLIFI